MYFWSERERGGEIFQGVRSLEAVAATRDHMLFGLGWFDGWGEGKVVFFKGRGVCGNRRIWREKMMSVA